MTSAGQLVPDMTATSDSSRSLKVFLIGNNDDDVEYITSCGCVASPPETADFVLARGTFSIMSGAEASKIPLSTAFDSTGDAASVPLNDSEASRDGVIAFSNAEDLKASIDPYLQRCKARGLPMLVSNPDFIRPGSGAPMPGQIGVHIPAFHSTIPAMKYSYITLPNYE